MNHTHLDLEDVIHNKWFHYVCGIILLSYWNEAPANNELFKLSANYLELWATEKERKSLRNSIVS